MQNIIFLSVNVCGCKNVRCSGAKLCSRKGWVLEVDSVAKYKKNPHTGSCKVKSLYSKVELHIKKTPTSISPSRPSSGCRLTMWVPGCGFLLYFATGSTFHFWYFLIILVRDKILQSFNNINNFSHNQSGVRTDIRVKLSAGLETCTPLLLIYNCPLVQGLGYD